MEQTLAICICLCLAHSAKTKHIFTWRDKSGDNNVGLGRVCAACWGVTICHTLRGCISFSPGRRLVCCLVSGNEMAGLPTWVPTGHHAHQQPVDRSRHSVLNNEPPSSYIFFGFPKQPPTFSVLPPPRLICILLLVLSRTPPSSLLSSSSLSPSVHLSPRDYFPASGALHLAPSPLVSQSLAH